MLKVKQLVSGRASGVHSESPEIPNPVLDAQGLHVVTVRSVEQSLVEFNYLIIKCGLEITAIVKGNLCYFINHLQLQMLFIQHLQALTLLNKLT